MQCRQRIILLSLVFNCINCDIMFFSVCDWVHECMFVLTPQHYKFLVLATW